MEIARQIQRIASWTDLDEGLTVNPAVLRGGTASNVVAERAWTDVDVRFPSQKQALDMEERFRSLSAG